MLNGAPCIQEKSNNDVQKGEGSRGTIRSDEHHRSTFLLDTTSEEFLQAEHTMKEWQKRLLAPYFWNALVPDILPPALQILAQPISSTLIWGRTPRGRHIIHPSLVRFPNAKVNIIFQTRNAILNHNTIYISNSHIFDSWIILRVLSSKFTFINLNRRNGRGNRLYLIYNRISQIIGFQSFIQSYINIKRYAF